MPRPYNLSHVEVVATRGGKVRYRSTHLTWPSPLRKSGRSAECDYTRSQAQFATVFPVVELPKWFEVESRSDDKTTWLTIAFSCESLLGVPVLFRPRVYDFLSFFEVGLIDLAIVQAGLRSL